MPRSCPSRMSDRTTFALEEANDITAQTRQVCENLKAAIDTGGGTMNDICRVDVYVRNIEQFEAIHKVRREYISRPVYLPQPWSR